MVKSKDEILASINSIVGENTSDEALALIEDVTDTLDEYIKLMADTTDWKAKYEENDEAWRKKYKDRFFGDTEDDIIKEDDIIEEQPTTFEELFKEEK